jgi:molybdate transport system permease protein
MGLPQKTIKPQAPIGLLLLALLLMLFLLLPVAVILGQALLNLNTLTNLAVLEALKVSALTTTTTVIITITLGTPVAYLLARYEFFGKAALDAALDLPLVLPPVVAGLGLLLTFGRNGILGNGLELAGIQLAFSPAAVIMAQLFVAAPYYIRTVRAGLMQLNPDLENAARVDGANENIVLQRITLPLLRPALLEGIILTWTRALGEFGATILFAGSLEGSTRTITLAVYNSLESDFQAALVLSGLMAVLAFTGLFILRTRSNQKTV